MAISSMTGFARVQVRVPLGDEDQLSYTLTVKSVNHRFLDLQFRLPSGLDALEMDLRKVLKENLVRGHVDLTLSVDRSSQTKAGYNRELISGYLAAFDAARREHELKGEPDLNAALRLPGALQAEDRSGDDLAALAASVLEQMVPLLEQLKTMRAREGEALEADSARHARPARGGHRRAWRSCVRRLSSATRSALRSGWPRPWVRSSTSRECLRKWRCWWSAATSGGAGAHVDAHRAFSRAARAPAARRARSSTFCCRR